ncbi:MAG: Maf family protein [Candidatus Acetothermia bacterium]|nr:Maf family protein [Candidatus Acetothermia bacterium]
MALDYENLGPTRQRLILASSSPRRIELLRLLCPQFEVMAPRVDEGEIQGPADLLRTARRKAETVRAQRPHGLVIAADTGVFRDGRAYGKPSDLDEAQATLRALAGGWHSVCTGLVLLSGSAEREALVTTRVLFKPLTEEEIAWYLGVEEVLDKAGAYAIQGRAAPFVERIEGDFFNVMGLPLATLYRLLRELGWRPGEG